MAFVQALTALDFRPVLLSGPADVKVVDVAIQRTLDALAERGHGDVLLASHDGDFAPHVARLLDDGGARRVGVLGFRELISVALSELDGLEIFDLEDDVGAFTVALPRIRGTPIGRFDPGRLLSYRANARQAVRPGRWGALGGINRPPSPAGSRARRPRRR